MCIPFAGCLTLDEGSDSSEKKGFAEGYWSEKEIKDIFLDEQRKYIWNKDYWRNVIVPLFKLKQNSIILDVGCGLGFLGQNLVEFVPSGKIIGVDLDAKLIEAARKIADNCGFSAIFDFRVGDAYDLPVNSNTVDLSICQTLLMHLEEPMKAISEMQRVTKNGGRVVAIEPDYASFSFFDSAYDTMGFSLEERVKLWRWNCILTAGKKKLGRGDNEIGSKVPYLFFKSGLRVVDVRCLDRAFWMVPPYQGRELELKHMMLPPEFLVEKLDMRTEFLAGGGTENEWKEYFNFMKKLYEIRQQQIKEKTFVSSSLIGVIITIAEKI
jgi:ubiquinone/menaquinone biosynthesis C-methylase UbiE